MKEFNLSDLEWDFSDGNSVVLKLGDVILNIDRDELEDFIESWDENLEE
jgi:hypothetical protein